MNYNIIIRPLIGAGIGYITNWIAVKMLFRPLDPVKIGKFRLPFTPGIIPKNKERIAISIGNSISANLLTEEVLKDNLLSDAKIEEIKIIIENTLSKYSENNTTIKQLAETTFQEEQLSNIENTVINILTTNIYKSIKNANLAEIISEQIQIAVKEKLKGSLLGMLGGNNIVSSLKPEITAQIDLYIATNGESLVNNMVVDEINKLKEKNVSDLIYSLQEDNIDISSTLLTLYKKIVINNLSSLLNTINVSKIVSDKIISMPTSELEKIILEIMKKELNALVNLGAIIGFILGLLNLLF